MFRQALPLLTTAAAVFVVALVFGTIPSCLEGADIAIWDCESPVLGHVNSDGNLDPCCIDPETPCLDGGPHKCEGTCMPVVSSVNFDPMPVLVWHGPAFQNLPSCPNEAMAPANLGRDPIVPNPCPLCACSEPACVLPDGLIAHGAPGCTGGPFTPFPSGPEGSCSNEAAIEPNQFQSVAILPLTVTPCVGSTILASDVPVPQWKTLAVVCNGLGNGVCDDPNNEICMPLSPPPASGFMRCVQNKTKSSEDDECPASYPNRHVYYEKIDYTPSCTPCECTPPVGSECKAEVTAYANNACTDDGEIFKVSIPQGPSVCVSSIPANTGLKGLTETWVVNQPGKCEPIPSMFNGTLTPRKSTAHEYCCADP